jgi:hypothetical protein
MPGHRERCLQAGATEYMSKSVSLKPPLPKMKNLLKTPYDRYMRVQNQAIHPILRSVAHFCPETVS